MGQRHRQKELIVTFKPGTFFILFLSWHPFAVCAKTHLTTFHNFSLLSICHNLIAQARNLRPTLQGGTEAVPATGCFKREGKTRTSLHATVSVGTVDVAITENVDGCHAATMTRCLRDALLSLKWRGGRI